MRPKIICLTPVKNEAWILDRFIQAASLWADHIIIADQMSTDGSQEIAQKYPKVKLIENRSETFNEPERQKLLIDEARKIDGRRLLITLDADEILTSCDLTSKEWQLMLTSEPGTIFRFQLANLRPDMQNMWLAGYFPWGYIDDGNEYTSSNKIHSGRIPLPSTDSSIITLEQLKVIHFQYTDWERMQSKHRWYQCFEKINFPQKKAISIFRMYHHMFAIPKNEIVPIPKEWIKEYQSLGIDITTTKFQDKYWWDEKVLEFMEIYGTSYFRKLNIWDVNWEEKAMLWGKENTKTFKDPRNRFDKYIQSWLWKTQPKSKKIRFRIIDKLLKLIIHY